MWGYFNNWGWGGGMMIFMLFFWVAIVWLIIFLMKENTNSSGSKNDNKTALDILQERYTRSEIDKKEYEEKLKVINKNN